MSAPITEIRDAIACLGGNLRYELTKIDLRIPADITATAIANWLSSARLNAELNGIIDNDCYLTPLGMSVIRAIKGGIGSDEEAIQEIATAGDFGIMARLTLLTIDDAPTSQANAIASLPEPDRDFFEWFDIVDDDWRLTKFGNDVVRYLRNN